PSTGFRTGIVGWAESARSTRTGWWASQTRPTLPAPAQKRHGTPGPVPEGPKGAYLGSGSGRARRPGRKNFARHARSAGESCSCSWKAISKDDKVNVGDAANTLDGIAGPLTVNGQGGTNALTVNDQGSGVGQTYTLTATTLNRSGAAAITYGAV